MCEAIADAEKRGAKVVVCDGAEPKRQSQAERDAVFMLHLYLLGGWWET